MGKRMIKRFYCRDLEYRVNTRTNHVVSIDEYPERLSDLTIDGKLISVWQIQKYLKY